MTLRGVIQSLVNGSGDAETALAESGYGDLPAEMFGQALSSYADTAPMVEADALSPILTAIDAGDAGDVFALIEDHPPTIDPSADLAGTGVAAVAGVDAFDDLDAPELDAPDLDAPELDAPDLDAPDLDAPDAADDPDFGVSTADTEAHADGGVDTEPGDDGPVEIEYPDLDGGKVDDGPERKLEDFDDEPMDTAADYEAIGELLDTTPDATGDDTDDIDF